MSIGITPAIEAAGYGISGDIGGLKRTVYYTPDGRIIRAIPQIRDWVKKNKEGKAIDSGVRDANLDKGWLLQMPQVKKLFCPHCDQWHDTQVEIEACKIQQDKMLERETAVAREELTVESQNKDIKIAVLEAKIEALTKLVEKALGKPVEI